MTKQLTLNQCGGAVSWSSKHYSPGLTLVFCFSLLRMVKELRPNKTGSSDSSDAPPEFTSPLEAALHKRAELDKEILALERQIFALETSYLENTAQIGDLVRGWGDITTALSAVSSSSVSSGHGSSSNSSSLAFAPSPAAAAAAAITQLKKRKVTDSERIFSSSSMSALRNAEFFHSNIKEQHRSSRAADAEESADSHDDFLTVGRPSKLQKTSKHGAVGREGSHQNQAHQHKRASRQKRSSASAGFGSPVEPLFDDIVENGDMLYDE